MQNFDEDCRQAFKNAKKNVISWFLIASYCYYIRHESILSDEVYDKMSLYILKEYDNIQHIHKHLITKEMLKAGTAYNLRRDNYPLVVIVCGEQLMDQLWRSN